MQECNRLICINKVDRIRTKEMRNCQHIVFTIIKQLFNDRGC